MGHTSPILSVLFVVLVEHWNFKSNNVVKSGNQVLPTPKVFGVSFCCFCYYCIFVLFVRGFLKQPGISPRCKHNVFLGLFWDFPWESAVTFKFSLYMQLFLNTQPLMSGLWKGKGEKWRGEKKTHPYTLLGSQISGGWGYRGVCNGGSFNNNGYPCLCTSVIRSINQQWEHRSPIFVRQYPFFLAFLLETLYNSSRIMFTATYHGAGSGDG